ncbi:MAG: SRPBCC family protein [Actinomycetota bacterium]
MTPLRADIVIAAPRTRVWDLLADLESVALWSPAVRAAECTSDRPRGLGAQRRCHMRPRGWLTETVTAWEPERLIELTVDQASPIKHGVGRFELSDHGRGTRLRAGFLYEVRLGPLGPVIDRLVVHRQLSSSWEQAVQGLRGHAERPLQTTITPSNPEEPAP